MLFLEFIKHLVALITKSVLIRLNPELEHVNRFSPEIYVHFIATQSLELIFPLVQVLKLFLEAFPQFYADSS